MKVIRAKVLGYCMGVRRAMDMVGAELRNAGGKGVYTMGPLIHNPQALEGLKRAGAEVLEEARLPDKLDGSVVIIRAHGISPGLEEALSRRGARLADATCPKVKASQLKAQALAEQGWRIFLAGERRHGEITGILGYAPDCVVAADREEAERAAAALFKEDPQAKTALMGQTTIAPELYRAIGEGIRQFFPHLRIIDTICGAAPQNALKALCSRVDAVIVAGGRGSANTRRLLAIAQSLGKPAWLVETAAELPREIASYPVVGLSAGASTPDEIIDDIEQALLACPSGKSQKN
jgi:4-hydroxy-3-methylbut-2-enyl diphosphate reductase